MKKTNRSKQIKYLTKAGTTAAVYVALTAISAMFGLASGSIQVRISEALCVLPVFTAAAVPGVTIGCLISNLILGGTVYDIIFGTLATLIGAAAARLFRRMPYLSPIPTIVSNTLIIPAVFVMSGICTLSLFPAVALSITVGEIISCGVGGALLVLLVSKNKKAKDLLSD